MECYNQGDKELMDWFCPNCNSKNEIPLKCRDCDIWLCSACWMKHDVEMMKKNGLLICNCGEDHS